MVGLSVYQIRGKKSFLRLLTRSTHRGPSVCLWKLRRLHNLTALVDNHHCENTSRIHFAHTDNRPLFVRLIELETFIALARLHQCVNNEASKDGQSDDPPRPRRAGNDDEYPEDLLVVILVVQIVMM